MNDDDTDTETKMKIKLFKYVVLGADYMSQAGSVAGLARSTEMTAQPGIT